MNPDTNLFPSASDLPAADHAQSLRKQRSVCWGAIIAGVMAALALQVLFMMLGAGLGFAIYSPLTFSSPMSL